MNLKLIDLKLLPKRERRIATKEREYIAKRLREWASDPELQLVVDAAVALEIADEIFPPTDSDNP